MKEYPFHELDYIVREEGSNKILSYLGEPDEPKLKSLQESVKWKVQQFIDEQFWGRVVQIAYNDIDLSQKVHHTFDWCFELAFWDIKNQWFSPNANDEHRRFLKQQYDKSISKSTAIIESKPEWGNYRNQYQRAYDDFINQLKGNLLGYYPGEPENQQVAANSENKEVFTPTEDALTIGFGNRRSPKIREIVYHRIINRLFKELVEQGLIADSADAKVNFRGVFYGPFQQKIDWVGNIGQLTYLLQRLNGTGVHDLDIIRVRDIWLTTANCFTRKGELLNIGNLYATHEPKGNNLRVMMHIVDELWHIIER